jgi:hypothetical protein
LVHYCSKRPEFGTVGRSGVGSKRNGSLLCYHCGMVKPWPTQRIALLYGAPFEFFFQLLLVDWDTASIDDVVGDCVGGAAVSALLFGVICASRNLILRAK